MTIIKRSFVCSDVKNNNNKFWEYIYNQETKECVFKYGRVGSTCNEEKRSNLSQKDIDSKVRDKLKNRPGKPAYQEIEVLSEAVSAKAVSKTILKDAAFNQLTSNNSALKTLVDRLVEANKHELFTISGGKLNLDTTTGIISTPVGVVTKSSITKARSVLDEMIPFVKDKDYENPGFITNLNNYLMLIPQKVGHAKGWHQHFIVGDADVTKQYSLLDQLESSADVALSSIKSDGHTEPTVFSTKLEILTDQVEIDRITKFFYDTLNKNHTSRNLKPKAFYKVLHEPAQKAFDNDGGKLTNIQQLWHGTRIFNVLSILKNGLICPPRSGTYNITGRMFSDGIYFSDQSTKSLNYSQGYWDGARDNNCFMFLCDVAMGKEYIPKSSYESLPKPGYDSTFAKANVSGVINNEMIVYRSSQTNLKYLIEFSH
jgi:poly [ADP-ribose] polymerase